MAVLPVGIGPEEGYNISRSLRFNSADSAYLNRTPSSAGSGQKFTVSWWQKLGVVGTSEQTLFSAGTGNTDTTFFVIYATGGGSGALANAICASGATYTVQTASVYRDPSAWYHIVVSVDTTQATALNRVKIYVNAVEVTYSSPSYPTQNLVTPVCQNVVQNIGRRLNPGDRYLSSYVTEFNLIDGQALTPSSFGETDPITGVWKPKKYTGTYGTNGFYLNFSDNSGTTATTLGKDYSGNGNNWTPNNFSVTAGAGNDSLVDVPTLWGSDTGAGGEVRGNYCTLNPLDKDSGNTVSDGNLQVATSSAGQGFQRATMYVSSGKWYWEVTVTSITGNASIGIAGPNTAANTSNYIGATSDSYGYFGSNGNKSNNASSSAYGSSYTNNDVIGVALDMDAGTLVFYKNNVSQGTAYSGLSGSFAPAVSDISGSGGSTIVANFGQRPFAYTAPSGFKALCTTNLPEPTIKQGDDYFNAVLYTGNGTSQSVAVGFAPDLVWAKARSSALIHVLFDKIRGASNGLSSNGTSAEFSIDPSLGTNGFTVNADINANGTTYVAWNWKANGTGVTNTAGTITSTVSANNTSGFSIVTYTGNGTSGSTVGHGLGVAPQIIIVKGRTNAVDWQMYHRSLGVNYTINLNSTAAATNLATYWGSSDPSSTAFTLSNYPGINSNTVTYVAYCFAPVAGFSAFGSYTGNGSTDGPFVFTGFRPRYVMVKQSAGTSAATSSWQIFDSSRDMYNVVGHRLQANQSGAEGAPPPAPFDFLSNGFKIRDTNPNWNENGGTYVYACFAESPFKYALGR